MYSLDANAARKADTSGSFIRELGKYVGEFTQAVDIETKKGGRGIELAFKSKTGQKANLALYTKSASGELYQGFDTLMSILTCMKLRNIKPVDGEFTSYDYDTKQDVQKKGKIFPELVGPIGLLLESEDYEKQDGSVGTRMVIKHAFDPSNDFTASEILDRKVKPEALAKMVGSLRHRPLKNRPAQRQNDPAPAAQSSTGSGGFDAMDDDIPFNDPLKSRALHLCIG